MKFQGRVLMGLLILGLKVQAFAATGDSPPKAIDFVEGYFSVESTNSPPQCGITLHNRSPYHIYQTHFDPPCGTAYVTFDCGEDYCDSYGNYRIDLIDGDRFKFTDYTVSRTGPPVVTVYLRVKE